MSQPGEATAGSNGGVRREVRSIVSEPVELTNLSRGWSPEKTSTHNISPRGARVTTQRLWEPGTFLMLKSLRSGFWARARVVYWRSFSSRAIIGLEFIVQSGDWPQGN
ncbi:MAG TPA: PilZ domain-containing protein [Candidatus Acidoferrum sp.]|nr:PilZ domain-containing protein [Candidatus Acidoferrum sp.]